MVHGNALVFFYNYGELRRVTVKEARESRSEVAAEVLGEEVIGNGAEEDGGGSQ